MAGVTIEHRPPIMVVTIDRPAVRNAVDGPTAAALADAVRSFESDDGVAAAVLTGAGGNFCSGADLKALTAEPGRANRVQPDGDAPMGPTRRLPSKPVIAAIEGYAVAGGLELALWCDLRIAATDATLGFFNRRWGVPLLDGGTVRLPRIVGSGRALDLILTGRAVDAAEALAMGLVNRTVSPGTALDEAVDLARSIAGWPRAAMLTARDSALRAWGLGDEAAMALEFELATESWDVDEMMHGADRFARGEGRHGSFERGDRGH